MLLQSLLFSTTTHFQRYLAQYTARTVTFTIPTMSSVWYCCYCGTGPYNASIIPACTSCSCQHHRCSGCKAETMNPQVEYSESQYPLAHDHTIGSRPSYSTPMSNASTYTFHAPLTSLTPTGVQPFNHLSLDTPEYSIPLTAANLASFDAPLTNQGQALGNSLSTSSRGQVKYCWHCCYCGNGPNSCSLDANCPNCHNHWRNECCRIEKIVIKK
jgi:hypothetical protein